MSAGTVGMLLLLPVMAQPRHHIHVNDGNLQAAIDRARPGDEILLPPGVRFEGNFVLPDTPSDRFITIRTDSERLPGPGVRTGPKWSGTLARLVSGNSDPVVRTAPGAHHWRIENLEIGPTGTAAGTIVELGSSTEPSVGGLAHAIVLDRVYIHGNPARAQRRGVALNSRDTQILNSYISEMKSEGLDSQAIAGWNGPGPFLIENNYLEAAGENVLFGGGDPVIAGLVPGGIVIRRNRVTRPLSWRGSGWSIKNLLELKNARDVTIADNLFEYHWAAAQSGYAIVLTPRNQDGGAPWSRLERIHFVNNVVRHVSAGINISGTDDECPSGRTRGIVIEGNRFEDVSGSAWGGPGDFVQMGNGPEDVRIEGNVVAQTGRILSVYGGRGGREIKGFVFRNNVVRHNEYGVIGSDAGIGLSTFAKYLPGAVFDGNDITGGDPLRYPAGNRFHPESP